MIMNVDSSIIKNERQVLGRSVREWIWTGVGFIGSIVLLLVMTKSSNVFELAYLWALFGLMPGVGAIVIVVLGYQRASWRAWELLLFIVPFVIWMSLHPIGTLGVKSLANLIELMWIGGGVIVAALLRLFVNEKRFRLSPFIIFISLCVAVIVMYYLVPPLPESSMER
jgi:hypothetical protein